MTAPAAGLFDDVTLVRNAQGGDREAFAQLYDRYFERIYDFVRRTLRNEADAADVTQEVFIKAMGSVGSLSNPLVFKSWLFTIARNLSISKIRGQRNTLSLDYSDAEEGDATLADVIPDTDLGGSPEDATERADTAAMVWAIAAGLDARQYTVLDLSVRQELAPEEMAEVLGVTRNNAYVMMNRTKAAFSDSCTDYMLYRQGRRECAVLAGDLEKAGVEKFSPEARKVLDRHVKRCELCGERKKRLPMPLAMFGGFALAAPPAGLHERIRSGILETPVGAAPPPGGEAGGLPGGGGGNSGSVRRRVTVVAAALGAVLIALFAGVATLAVLDDDDKAPLAEPDNEVVPTLTPTATSTPRPGQTATATPASPTAVAGANATPSPSAVSTIAVVPPPPTNTPAPGSTATPTPTRTPTPTVTPTRTPMPTITPTAIPPSPTPIPPEPPTAIPPSPTPITPTVPPPPPDLEIASLQYCWIGTIDLRFTISVTGANGPVSGTASYHNPPHTNFNMAGPTVTVTMFGNPYMVNQTLTVDIQTASQNATRSVSVASPPGNQC